MQQLSITRALAEIKLLNSRIEDTISSTRFVIGYKRSAKKVNNIDTPDEFNSKVKSEYQSINDLIERRKLIKSAIVQSNSKTIINVAGKEMTVSDAIERKDSIKYEKLLLDEMTCQYNQTLALTQRNNDQVELDLKRFIESILGKESKDKENEISNISKAFKETNEYVILDILKMDEKIKALKLDIETFLMEVDYSLSTSNALTMIEI